MIDSRDSIDTMGSTELNLRQESLWVKPILQKLSLKQALTDVGHSNDSTCLGGGAAS
jgi:hypothetical protein